MKHSLYQRARRLLESWLRGGGLWINRHSYIRIALIISSVLFSVLSLFVSDRLVAKIALEEHEKLEMWTNAVRATNSYDQDMTMTYLYRILEANTAIPIIVTDQDGVIISYNNIDLPEEGAERYLQRELARMRGGYPPIVISETASPQYVYYSDSNGLRYLTIFPYIQLGGFVLFLLVALVAIISLKRSDQNRLWEGLSRETAHQLGTPISSLMAWKEYLESMGTEPMVTEEMGKDIERLGIIADRFQKIGSATKLQTLDLHEVLLRALHYMQPRISRQVELVPPEAPEEPILVSLSEPLIAWVFENLIKNAVDAMQGKGTISFAYQLGSDRVFVDITDTGKGIPKGELRRIFRPGVTTRQRGWGLGLSLALRIIEEYHKGRIYVLRSTPGVGTTFRIELDRLPS